jgi:hypothetical protein
MKYFDNNNKGLHLNTAMIFTRKLVDKHLDILHNTNLPLVNTIYIRTPCVFQAKPEEIWGPYGWPRGVVDPVGSHIFKCYIFNFSKFKGIAVKNHRTTIKFELDPYFLVKFLHMQLEHYAYITTKDWISF